MPEPIITVEGLSKLPRSRNDEQATKRYFATALDFLAESAIMVFDDINWSEDEKSVTADFFQFAEYWQFCRLRLRYRYAGKPGS